MSDLFDSYDLSGLLLPNRIVMAPLTRARAKSDAADELIALYYAQRSTAGLIISEGTPISRQGQGYVFNPGIFLSDQIAGWRKVTRSAHSAGGRIFAQLWHVGRVSHFSIQGRQPVSATDRIARGAMAFGYDEQGQPSFLPVSSPYALTTTEVGRIVEDFAIAADNAVAAGFDGIELHAANGYLFEQFLNPLVNDRTDRYSADLMENRLRFTLEVVDAVNARIGSQRVGIRFSPFGQNSDMPPYPDAEQTYLQLGRELADRRIAYMHFMDQSGYRSMPARVSDKVHSLLRKLRPTFDKGALVLAGGQTPAKANELIASGTIDLAAFGQPFIANPDLVARLRNGWPLAEPERETYYGGGAEGYVDYPPYRNGRAIIAD
ncbi:MAG: N-ethylmaleimide reductase [Alphaproteobacteria bacterium]|nr:N-ethylmaleimide reductase [Alphaproteobacteria bacterium]